MIGTIACCVRGVT